MNHFVWLAALTLSATGVSAQPRTPMTEVPVLAHMVSRGEVLGHDDFVMQDRSVAQVRNAIEVTAAVGQEATRTLSAGTVVRANDVTPPRLVRRGEPVAITIRSAGLSIATQGRALASGGVGDHVRVVAASTNRTLDGVVEGPDAVRVIAP